MKKYVALLRGINVGGNKKVPMAELTEVFEKMGYGEVRTYINSGNVIFASAKQPKERAIEKAIAQRFGFPVPTIVRTAENIKKVAKAIPSRWGNDAAHHKTDVLFLWAAFDSKATIQKIKTTTVDTLVYVPGAIIWHLKRKDYTKSGMHDLIGTEVYKHMTARNVNTVRKLAELLDD